jgi:hypothetical protein
VTNNENTLFIVADADGQFVLYSFTSLLSLSLSLFRLLPFAAEGEREKREEKLATKKKELTAIM